MNNILKLHEAIAVVLLSEPRRTATIEHIAQMVNRRKLYTLADQKPVPAYQVMMRAKLSKGRYAHMLTYNQDGTVTLTK
jgi:hypothetical protein